MNDPTADGEDSVDQPFEKSEDAEERDPGSETISTEARRTSGRRGGKAPQDAAQLFGEAPTLSQDGIDISDKPAGRLIPRTATLPDGEGTITEKPGSRIGPYKLLQQIGEGGFGVVYLAEQRMPIKRKVALKIIKPGMDTREVIARFEAERQALALMDHPNIARVFDAGATETGRPYFVMELIKGVPVTEYCDIHRLGTRQRLQLFRDICGAVQHAHQKGIIHRDLKPSNILVTLHDTGPAVKVIDFGIAKAISRELTEKTLFTALGQMVGTPQYMSPEQSEMSGLDVDTRSDIYSLGVILYELLTGRTPLDPEQLRQAGLDEIHRLIREEEPPRPSTRLSGLTEEEITTIAKAHHEAPEKLNRLVRGDLDWIVMKALEKDRGRRYETATEFAADIGNYLTDQPVLASPPSTGYRLRKFVRRNRAALTTAVLVFSIMVAATAVSIWQATIATDAQSVAEQETINARNAEGLAEQRLTQIDEQRRAAERGQAEAEAVAGLMEEMLASADPLAGEGAELTVRKMLDVYSKKLDTQLQAQPEAEMRIRSTIGSAFFGLGEWEHAEPHLKRALDLSKSIYGERHFKTAEAMRQWGKLLLSYGLYVDAEDMLRKAFLIVQENKDVPPEEAANFSASWARSLINVKKTDESVRLYYQALNQYGYTEGKQSEKIALVLNILGSLGDPPLLEESLHMFESLSGTDDPHLIPVLFGLSMDAKHYSQEERGLFRERLYALSERHFGNHHRTAYYKFQTGWNIYLTGGDANVARGLMKEAKQIALAAIEEGRGDPGDTYFWLGFYAADSEDTPGAVEYLEKSVAYFREHKSRRLTNYRSALMKLGGYLPRVGRKEEGITVSEEALSLTEKIDGKQSTLYGYALTALAKAFIANEQYDEAEKRLNEATGLWETAGTWSEHQYPWQTLASLLHGTGRTREAIKIWQNIVDTWIDNESAVEQAYRALSTCLLSVGEAEKAEAAAREAIAIAERHFGKYHTRAAQALQALVAVHKKRGELDKAEAALERILKIRDKPNLSRGSLRNSLVELAAMKRARGKFDEAEQLYHRAIEVASEPQSTSDPNKANYMLSIGATRLEAGDFEGAKQIISEVIEFRKERFGEADPELPRCYYELGIVLEKAGDQEEAEEAHRKRLDILREHHPEDHKNIAYGLSKLAIMCRDRGEDDAAEGFFKGAIDAWVQAEGNAAPQVLSAIYYLADFYRRMGRYEEALPLYKDVWKKRTKLLGEKDPASLQAMRMIGSTYRSIGAHKQAREILEAASKLCDDALGTDHIESIAALSELGYCYRYSEHYREAIVADLEKLKRQREGGVADREVVSTLHELAYVSKLAGERDSAIGFLEEKSALQKKSLGDSHFDAGRTLVDLGSYLFQESRLADSEIKFREAVAIFEKSDREIWRRFDAMSRLGEAFRVQGKLEEAREAILSACLGFEEHRKEISRTNPKSIEDARSRLTSLSESIAKTYSPDEKIEWFKHVLGSIRKVAGEDSPGEIYFTHCLADAEKEGGDLIAAISTKRDEIQLVKKLSGEDGPATLRGLSALGYWLMQVRKAEETEEAIQILDATLGKQQEAQGADHKDTISTMDRLGTAYSYGGHHEKSLSTRRQVVPLLVKAYGKDHAVVLGAKRRLAYSLRATGDHEGAFTLLGEVAMEGENKYGSEHAEVLAARQDLGTNLVQAKRFAEAEPVVRACLEGRKKADPKHWRVFSDTSLLGETLVGQKRFEEAETFLLRGYEGLKAHKPKLGSGDLWHLASSLNRLVRLYTEWGKPEEAAAWKAVKPELE